MFYFKKIIFCSFIAILMLSLTGCVERRLTINTIPQDATVFLGDEEIGQSPVTVNFNWYGDYRVRIEKQGYETLNTHRELCPPLHDRFPFDFFAEILNPSRIVDEYEWCFELCEYQAPDRDELIETAQQLRERANRELN